MEKWKRIKGYNHYFVSNNGKVISKKYGNFRILKTDPCGDNYSSVSLYNNGICITYKVSVLVAEHFIGPCPKGMEVDHIDGNKLNNRDWNLEYVTHSENLKRAVKLNLLPCIGHGLKNPGVKLSWRKVNVIRMLLNKGNLTHKEISEIYEVCEKTISLIKHNKIWRF